VIEINKKEIKEKFDEQLVALITELGELAKNARDKCRFIKSTTEVGCSILTNNNEMTWGCNFDYEWGIAHHAEDTAICNMIGTCAKDSKIRAVYLYIEGRKNFTSCGNCRDKIRLFAEDKKACVIYLDDGETLRVYSLSELLPHYPER